MDTPDLIHEHEIKTCVVIVAHPDDETLWSGGTILTLPHWHWLIISLCRKYDLDRSSKFEKAMKALNAKGLLSNLDDSPNLLPLKEKEIEQALQSLLPKQPIDLILTHSPEGEYTRHKRHEEIGRAVIELWHAGKIRTKKLWVFAYQDNQRAYVPRPDKMANLFIELSREIWLEKYKIITEIYGFVKESWEAKTTPVSEAFWEFAHSEDAMTWLKSKGTRNENTGIV